MSALIRVRWMEATQHFVQNFVRNPEVSCCAVCSRWQDCLAQAFRSNWVNGAINIDRGSPSRADSIACPVNTNVFAREIDSFLFSRKILRRVFTRMLPSDFQLESASTLFPTLCPSVTDNHMSSNFFSTMVALLFQNFEQTLTNDYVALSWGVKFKMSMPFCTKISYFDQYLSTPCPEKKKPIVFSE